MPPFRSPFFPLEEQDEEDELKRIKYCDSITPRLVKITDRFFEAQILGLLPRKFLHPVTGVARDAVTNPAKQCFGILVVARHGRPERGYVPVVMS